MQPRYSLANNNVRNERGVYQQRDGRHGAVVDSPRYPPVGAPLPPSSRPLRNGAPVLGRVQELRRETPKWDRAREPPNPA